MERRANIAAINGDIYRIDDAGESTCYLVTGETRALLIDTANGRENLADIVGELTDMPVTVVNTHGHIDHVYGNVYFSEAYMHPSDFKLHDAHFRLPEADALKKQGLKPCRLLPLKDDEVFDLGGVTLETIPVPGHTPGSVALLCRKHRMLFTGDAIIGHLWMQLEESAGFGALKNALESLLERCGSAFDYILTGHGTGPEDAFVARNLLNGVTELLRGDCGGDKPYRWFGGTDMAHVYGPRENGLIAYNQTRLDIERGLRKPYPPVLHLSDNPTLAGLADTRLDIVYSTATGQELKLALVTPWGAKEKPDPLPLAVFVQGSGFTFPNIGYELGQLAYYARNGIAVATVTHRSCLDGHPFPAYLQDVKTAIRFLRSRAQEYNIDAGRIGIFGTSSGGNTALLAGLTGDDPRFKTKEYGEESDAVCLVVECFGPTDLQPLCDYITAEENHAGNIFYALAGEGELKRLLFDISPVNYVEKGKAYPPFLLIHGDADSVVPYHQMLTMHRRLFDAGADVRAVCVDGAPHEGSFWSWELHELILRFMQEALKR